LFGCCFQLNASAAPAATLSHITVTGAHHDLGVAITTTAPITPRIEIVTEPARLIVDLPDVLPSAGLRKIFVNRGKLKDIRVGLLSANPRITRVVLDLLAPIPYRLLPLRNSLVVNLGEEAHWEAAQSAPIGATTKLPVDTRSAETISAAASVPAVVTLPPAPFSPERSRARWILPILTMGTVFAMLVIALITHLQNRRMRRGI
jgi:hypothetical protein